MALNIKTWEDFENLWKEAPTVNSTPFSESADSITQNSFICKMMRSELQVNHFFKKKDVALMDEGQIDLEYQKKVPIDELVPGYSIKSYIPQPSAFDQKTMNQLFYIALCMSQNKDLTPDQLTFLAENTEDLKQEQAAYLKFVTNQWLQFGVKKHSEIIPEIYDYTCEFWKARIERVYSYPKFYSQVLVVPLAVESNVKINIRHVSNIESIGKITRKYFLANLRTYVVKIHDVAGELKDNLIGNIEMNKTYGDNYPAHKSRPPKDIKYHPEISRDETALGIVERVESPINIVMSSSSFCSMLNFTPEASWMLPFAVKEVKTASGDKKVVLIDKKLPPTSMNNVDRNKIFAKYALKKLITRPATNYRSDSSNFHNYVDLETFGIEKDAVAAPTSSSKSPCDCKILTLDNLKLEGNPEDESFDDTSQHHYNPSDYKCTCSNAKRKKLRTGTFLIEYNLWEFIVCENEHVLSKKEQLKNLNVVIRTTKEAQLFNEGRLQHCRLSAKLEHQSEYGAESVTLSEILKEWASLYIRPDTILVRARLEPFSGEIVQFEKKTLDDLTKECYRLHGINPYHKLNSMHSLLSKLTDLKPGNYFMNHDPKNDAFVQILGEANGNHTLNLTMNYSSIDVKTIGPQRSPWIPLDTTVITPTFHFFRRVPCSFAPKSSFIRKKPKKSKFHQAPRAIRKDGKALASLREAKLKRKWQLKKTPKNTPKKSN